MPMPSRIQAAISIGIEPVTPSSTRPAAIVRLEVHSTGRPPNRSICRPMRGPSSAEITSAAEKAAKIQLADMPRSRPIGSARIAGR